MPVSLSHIRSELLPGLFDVRGSYDMIPRQWDKVFGLPESMPTLPLPSVPMAIAAGIAAVVIRNPEITRRFWSP